MYSQIGPVKDAEADEVGHECAQELMQHYNFIVQNQIVWVPYTDAERSLAMAVSAGIEHGWKSMGRGVILGVLAGVALALVAEIIIKAMM